MTYMTHLECTKTGESFDPAILHNLSPAGAPLFPRYDLAAARKDFTKVDVAAGPPSLWRYGPLLPVTNLQNIISLGEGFTPLLHASRLGGSLGMERLLIKEEGLNPTGSFKARGLVMAVNRARELGVEAVVIPSAGNAAGAMSAYAAAAGMKAVVYMPQDTPSDFVFECKGLGAEVHLIDGLITDCGKIVAERKEREGWFDLSTFKEPYRVEGKKTMGYELAEQLGWRLPDVIIYPTGGGTGLVGMWKAFDEMEQMGWIDSKRPRMVSVQSEGCAPIIRAMEEGSEHARLWENAHTIASGLRVPGAVADFLILRAIRESGGTAVAVSDEAMLADSWEIARKEGVLPAPEGGATLSALRKLLDDGRVTRDEEVVLYNTGSAYKYQDNMPLA
ncbi:MAG TPA: threonine synthase [Acidobacteriota bacterium]|nr:threonine synthase [Acidobacteriota bacterium]